MNTKETIKQKILDELANINVEKLANRYTEKLATEVQAIADAVLGIDRSWSRLEVKSGAINKLVENHAKEYITTRFAPLFEIEMRKQLSRVDVKNSVKRCVETRIRESISNELSPYTNSKLKQIIDDKVQQLAIDAIEELDNEHQTHPL